MNDFGFYRILASTALLFLMLHSTCSQVTLHDCMIEQTEDLLRFGNNRFTIEFLWNNGDIRGRKISNLNTAHSWDFLEGSHEIPWVPDSMAPRSADLKVFRVTGHEIYPDHMVGEISMDYGSYEMRRTYRLYPDIGVLAMHLSLKKNSADSGRLDRTLDEKLLFPGRHWKIRSVEFFDRTDVQNNLVRARESLAFSKPLNLRGNVLIARDLRSNENVFIIKEAPLGESQLLYPGFDFQVKYGEITIKNLGAIYSEVPEGQWFRCYGYVLGIGGEDDLQILTAIRDYMKSIRQPKEQGEEMIMLNTWGDRGQDGKISEVFALDELRYGKALGITHLQLDDGWQQGLSKNSKSASGLLWDRWTLEDWQPHPERFPSGLGPVMDAARGHGIGIGLWFHPSNANSYETWENDAEILLGLFREYGIRTFKIDGMELNDKVADIHMRGIFDTVSMRSGGNVIFNLDATAGQRGGYFYLNEYGNIFLENRYTDWGNYYPHWTLRNLWQLSEYVPPEKLQIEFLNHQRNPHMYDGMDPLRPSALPFDYVFATAMAGQPLAWMETSGLPEEAFQVSTTIESYKEVMKTFHQGYIFPIGEMPDGYSWTGFQSISDQHSGYFLIYREYNDHESCAIQTYIKGDRKKVRLEKILGYGSDFECNAGHDGRIVFRLPSKCSFALFHYIVVPDQCP